MKRRKDQPDRPKVDTAAGEGLTSSPFTKLAALRDQLPEAEGPSAEHATPRSEAPPTAPSGARRAVLRYERKGRGGKEVTVVERLSLPLAELDRLLSELKRSLGCGGVREGDTLVLQGDQRDRLRPWLDARGR